MMPNNDSNTGIAIWRFLKSLKLTILLLILLAILALFGTFVPVEKFDMYHSSGFRLLIGCLALNLILCSIDQLPGTWKRFSNVPNPDRNRPFENIPEEQVFLVNSDIKGISAEVSRIMKKRYGRIHAKESADKHFFYADKGRFAHFGVYLIHFSVLLVLVGAMIGSFFGFEGFVNIVEGDTVSVRAMHLSKGKIPPNLDFDVRCDRFTMEFYNDDTIKEYRSELSFLVHGKEISQQSLIVNHPAEFRGINFYQSKYGAIPGKKVSLVISHKGQSDKTHHMDLEMGKPVPLPNSSAKLSVVSSRVDFMGAGPAVLVEVTDDTDKATTFWVFQNYERVRNFLPGPMLLSVKFNPAAFKPFVFSLDHLEKVPYTGLQVTRDPGVPAVWAGFFMMVAGFIVTFFMSHKRIWVRVEKQAAALKVSVTGTSERNPMDLNREIENLLTKLKKRLHEAG